MESTCAWFLGSPSSFLSALSFLRIPQPSGPTFQGDGEVFVKKEEQERFHVFVLLHKHDWKQLHVLDHLRFNSLSSLGFTVGERSLDPLLFSKTVLLFPWHSLSLGVLYVSMTMKLFVAVFPLTAFTVWMLAALPTLLPHFFSLTPPFWFSVAKQLSSNKNSWNNIPNYKSPLWKTKILKADLWKQPLWVQLDQSWHTKNAYQAQMRTATI